MYQKNATQSSFFTNSSCLFGLKFCILVLRQQEHNIKVISRVCLTTDRFMVHKFHGCVLFLAIHFLNNDLFSEFQPVRDKFQNQEKITKSF